MPPSAPLRRLNKKTKAAVAFAPSRKKKTKKKTLRRLAVEAEVVPKARKPFALFLKDHSQAKKGMKRNVFLKEMARVGKLWRDAPMAVQAEYRRRSHEEMEDQRQSCFVAGVAVRTRDDGKAWKPPPPAPSTLATPASSPSSFAFWKIPGYTSVDACLGQGTYGAVLRASNPHGQLVAIKIFKDGDHTCREELAVYDRLEKLARSDRRLFVDVLAFDLDARPWPYIVFAFAGVDVATAVEQEPAVMRSKAWHASAQLQRGLAQLHLAGVRHLDVKPSNLMWEFATATLRIADMGLAVVDAKPEDELAHRVVTAGYRAPELWILPTRGKVLTPQADMFSFGAVMHFLLFGKHLLRPFDARGDWQAPTQAWARHFSELASFARSPSASLRMSSTPSSSCDKDFSQYLILRSRIRMPSAVAGLILQACHSTPEKRQWPCLEPLANFCKEDAH